MSTGDTERTGSRDRADAHAEGARPDARAKFGGFNWGSAFFGWLVAVAVSVLLLALVGAIGGPIAGSSFSSGAEAAGAAGTVGIIAGIVLLLVLALAYYAGGYVAGRMARFEGGRQGLGVWIVGLVVTILLAIAGAILGSQFNVLSSLSLPTIPNAGSLGIGALVTLLLVLVVTLFAAMAGGKAGQRYHRKVDHALGAP